MVDNITVAIDGMGGDHAPDLVVQGIALANRRNRDVRFLLYGDARRIEPLMAAHAEAAAMTEIAFDPYRIDLIIRDGFEEGAQVGPPPLRRVGAVMQWAAIAVGIENSVEMDSA